MTWIERSALRNLRRTSLAGLLAALALAVVPAPAEARDGSGWFALGQELHGDGDYDQAAAAFEKAAERGYRPDVSLYNAACAWARKGDADRAFERLGRALDAGFDAWGMLAKDDDLDALRGDPRFRDVERRLRAGESDSDREEAAAAGARLERLEASGSRQGESWFEVGHELHSAGEHARAARAWERAESLGYREGTSAYNAACARALAGDEDGAFEWLARAIEEGFAQPDHMREDSDLASLRGKPRFGDTLKAAEALELPPIDSSPRHKKSWTEAVSRDTLARAQRHLEGAPKSGHAWSNIGHARLGLDQPAEALAAFQRALELGYRKPVTTYNIACAYARLGDRDHAFEWLGKAGDAGFEWSWRAESDDDLASLRGDPRFRTLAREQHRKHLVHSDLASED